MILLKKWTCRCDDAYFNPSTWEAEGEESKVWRNPKINSKILPFLSLALPQHKERKHHCWDQNSGCLDCKFLYLNYCRFFCNELYFVVDWLKQQGHTCILVSRIMLKQKMSFKCWSRCILPCLLWPSAPRFCQPFTASFIFKKECSGLHFHLSKILGKPAELGRNTLTLPWLSSLFRIV